VTSLRKPEDAGFPGAPRFLGIDAAGREVLTFVPGEVAGRLSGGQQKLLELARVLVAEPKLILLDEPAAGVNPVLLETLVDRIVRLNRSGVTFLVIEHNIDLVMTVCRPIVVMAQGKLIYHGDAAGVRQDRRVLDAYLGGMPA